MQKINIVCVGKIKEEFFRAATKEYLKRLSRFADVTVRETEEGKSLEEEAKNILKFAKGYIFALCVEGKKLSSEAFAAQIKTLCDKGEEISFIIGSSCGLAQTVKEAANFKLSFSEMTFPHQLFRVILCEQLYRAFMINTSSTYHK